MVNKVFLAGKCQPEHDAIGYLSFVVFCWWWPAKFNHVPHGDCSGSEANLNNMGNTSFNSTNNPLYNHNKKETQLCALFIGYIASISFEYLTNTLIEEHFEIIHKFLNLKFSPCIKIHIFQCMGKIYCVEFQRVPLKFHTRYLTHTLKDMIFIQHWSFKSSWIKSSGWFLDVPQVTQMHPCTRSSLVELVACQLLDTKSLPKPILNCYQLDI